VDSEQGLAGHTTARVPELPADTWYRAVAWIGQE
jgi:hypothetical protein